MTDQDAARAKAAEARAAQAADRELAMADYKEDRRAVVANTERLRALRLARDAELAAAAPAPKKAKPRKKAASA